MSYRVAFGIALTVLCADASPVVAQDGAFVTAGRVLAGTPTESSWRVTVERDIVGPLGVDFSALELPGSRAAGAVTSRLARMNSPVLARLVPAPGDPSIGAGDLYGVGADLTLFSAARGVPTILVGVSGGLGTRGQSKLWAGTSVGIRMPIVVVGPVRLMAEGRWRSLTIEGRNGVELGVALGFRTPRRSPSNARENAGLWVAPPTADILRDRGIPEAKARLLGNVVNTAIEEMGQPYVWGGTGNGSGGFDCSGLIQFAYARYNIALPRTSVGQARAGVAIKKSIEVLLPGDILVFSDHGDEPTHVALYVGDGKFIHSASHGVRLSRLSEDDTEGRLWLRKWIGVRRVVD